MELQEFLAALNAAQPVSKKRAETGKIRDLSLVVNEGIKAAIDGRMKFQNPHKGAMASAWNKGFEMQSIFGDISPAIFECGSRINAEVRAASLPVREELPETIPVGKWKRGGAIRVHSRGRAPSTHRREYRLKSPIWIQAIKVGNRDAYRVGQIGGQTVKVPHLILGLVAALDERLPIEFEPGPKAEYIRIHKAIWSTIAADLSREGIRKLVNFLDNKGLITELRLRIPPLPDSRVDELVEEIDNDPGLE